MRYINTILLIPILLSIYCCGGSGHGSNGQNKNGYGTNNSFAENVNDAMEYLHPGYNSNHEGETFKELLESQGFDDESIKDELKEAPQDSAFPDFFKSEFFQYENGIEVPELDRQEALVNFVKNVKLLVPLDTLKQEYGKYCPNNHDSKEDDQQKYDDIEEQKIDPDKFKVTIDDFMELIRKNSNISNELLRYKDELTVKLLRARLSTLPIDQMKFSLDFDLIPEIEKEMPLGKCCCCSDIGFKPEYGYQPALVGKKCSYSHGLLFCKGCIGRKDKRCYQCNNKTLEEIKKEYDKELLDKANRSDFKDYLKIFDIKVIENIKDFGILEAYWETFQCLLSEMFVFGQSSDSYMYKLGCFDFEKYSSPKIEENEIFYTEIKEIDKYFEFKYRALYAKLNPKNERIDTTKKSYDPEQNDADSDSEDEYFNDNYKKILNQKFDALKKLPKLSEDQIKDINEYIETQYKDSYMRMIDIATTLESSPQELDDAFKHIVFLHQCSLKVNINQNVKEFLNPRVSSEQADTKLIKNYLTYRFSTLNKNYSNILLYKRK